jgi:uncharacterized DUF497 family protein
MARNYPCLYTRAMEFEWDEAKRLINLAKHGIDFLRARVLFDGRPTWTKRSDFPNEERWLTCGLVDQRFMTVVWTPRGTKVRLVSARRSRDEEKREYRQLYGG